MMGTRDEFNWSFTVAIWVLLIAAAVVGAAVMWGVLTTIAWLI